MKYSSTSILFFLLVPQMIGAAPHVDLRERGVPLPTDNDPDLHPTWPQPFISDLDRMLIPMEVTHATVAAPLKELEPNWTHFSNPLDERVKKNVRPEIIDAMLWEEVHKAKENAKAAKIGIHVGPERNAELHYAVRASYVCPRAETAYRIGWTYKLIEVEHGDWEKVNNGNKSECLFNLRIENVHGRRLSSHTPDETMDMHWANHHTSRQTNVSVKIVRGDDWKRPPHGYEQAENAAFLAEPIVLDDKITFYGEMYRAFATLTNLTYSFRFFARCEHLKGTAVPFYGDLCPHKDFYDGSRAFWGKSRMQYDHESAIDMHSLLKDTFHFDQWTCGYIDAAPARLHTQDQAFILLQDVPSIFTIDTVKVKSNYEHFILSDPHPLNYGPSNEPVNEARKEPGYTRHLDQTDLIMTRVQGHEFEHHMMDADRERIRLNRIADCEQFDNALYRAYLELPWYEKFIEFFRPRSHHVNCE